MAAVSFSREMDVEWDDNANAVENATFTPLTLEGNIRWKNARFKAARRRDFEELGVFIIFT